MSDLSQTLPNLSLSLDQPGLQIAWDSISLGALKTCPRYYQYSILEGYVPRAESVHLTFGLHYHKALERYQHARADGKEHNEAVGAAVLGALIDTWDLQRQRPWFSDHPQKNRETLIRTIIWYLDEKAQDDAFETAVLANGKPAVELSFRLQTGLYANTGEEFLLCGHMDRVAKLGDDYYVIDAKTTTTTLDQSFFRKFTPDNQFSAYTLAGQVVWSFPIKGIVVDGAQIAVTFSRFLRGIVERHPTQVQEWFQDFGIWLGQAQVYASMNYWPMNDKSCLAGATIVRANRGKNKGLQLPIAKLYRWIKDPRKGPRFDPTLDTYLLSDVGGYVAPQKLLDIVSNGIKPVYEIKTRTKTIKATIDHEFNTPQGWRTVDNLTPGDELYVWQGKKNKASIERVSQTRNTPITGIKYHPRAWVKWDGREPVFSLRPYTLRLEAHMNDLSYDEYLHILRSDKDTAKDLVYIAPGMEVHHKDGNHLNDSLDNLELVTMVQHKLLHMDDVIKAMNRLSVETVESIKLAGEEEVFDIMMEGPHHNFIANDFVAHNCSNYGGCPYRSICSKPPSVRQEWLNSDFTKRIWDPLRVRGDI